jgi:hypothetical protein
VHNFSPTFAGAKFVKIPRFHSFFMPVENLSLGRFPVLRIGDLRFNFWSKFGNFLFAVGEIFPSIRRK